MAKLRVPRGYGPWIYEVEVTINGEAPDMSVAGRTYEWDFYQGTTLQFTRLSSTAAHRVAALTSDGKIKWQFLSNDDSITKGTYRAVMVYKDTNISPDHRVPLEPDDEVEFYDP